MSKGRAKASAVARLRLAVSGIVQGVGFRPFVYRLAHDLNLAGFVRNSSAGVLIEIEGQADNVLAFARDLKAKAPPLARIESVSCVDIPVLGEKNFHIVLSESGQERSALISPDIAVCEDCLCELLEPRDRRYFYPFINCTNCGPRYTIVQDIPYDRALTTMRVFPMCPACRAEYDDPCNRRFHAQPNACHVCGPHVWLADAAGRELIGPSREAVSADAVVNEAARLLREGFVLAIKGVGGFHLAVDATNEAAVRRLRERKRREEKSLAVMSPDLSAVRRYAAVSEADEVLLTGIQRPIVLLPRLAQGPLADSVAPRSKYFGAMLPYSPLHHLLLRRGFVALVMTSGNLSEEPIATDNGEALSRLGNIADYFVLHNRDIYLRADDSVVRVDLDRPVVLRRSRGYAPAPVRLKVRAPCSVLAVGAELKNTVCVTKGDNAFISQHVGDLKNVAECEFFEMTIRHLKTIFQIEPAVIAHDLHPDYRSTRYALAQQGVRRTAVQHHHAHIASCLAENGRDEKVIGLSFDGTGYGSDGNVWGGEFLIADLAGFERAAHFRYVPMPGGDRAVEEPLRMALSWLYAALGEEVAALDLDALTGFGNTRVGSLLSIIRGGINSPLTSSVGRIFDAVAALTGICRRATYEGQPAIELEAAADPSSSECYPYHVNSTSVITIDLSPTFRAIVAEISKASPARIAAKLHNTIAAASAEVCERLRDHCGLRLVALSGGVFQNQLLTRRVCALLRDRGFEVLRHHNVPPNDGGISLGQAAVALRQLIGS